MLLAVFGALTILAIVAASLGYGYGLLRLAGVRDARLPLAITGGAGLALLSALAGWPVAAGSFSRGTGLLLLAPGIALLVSSARELPRPRRPGFVQLALAALAALFVVPRLLGAANSENVNICDDWGAYYHLPKLLLESGSLDEPFGFRRLGTLGVAPLLQSYFFPLWGTAGIRVPDAALGGLLVWGAGRAAPALTMPRPPPVRVEAFGLAAVLLSLAIPIANAAPVLLPMGSALLLFWLTAALVRGHEHARAALALAVFWGASAALLTGLRTSNVVFPGLLGLAGLALALVRRDVGAVRRWLLAALAFVLALAPWSVASWRSSGTPLFPLIPGNYRFPSGLLAPLSAGETLEFVARAALGSGIWLPLLLAAVVARRSGWGGAAGVSAAALAGTVVATALAFTATDDFSVIRYVTPFVAASVVFLAALWLGALAEARGGARPRRHAALLFTTLAALIWPFLQVELKLMNPKRGGLAISYGPALQIRRSVGMALASAGRTFSSGVQGIEVLNASDFTRVQDLLAADARIVSAVTRPFLWRFDRQVVHMLDCPGQASPPPGMPFSRGPDALARYLVDLGYTHLAFTPPARDLCLYSLPRWRAAKQSGHFLWEAWAPYFIDFLTNEQLIAQRGGVIFEGRELTVVDLRRALGEER